MSVIADHQAEAEGQDEMHTEVTRLLIADDHPLILAGLRRMIERLEDIEIVGEARSGTELLQLVERRRPSVVLTDLRMPDLSGTSYIEEIRSRWPKVKVVILSASDDATSIDAALRAGASAYVVKTATPVDLAAVLRQASSGAVFHAPTYTPGAAGAPSTPSGPALTERELAVLTAVAAGRTTAAISRELWVSEHTVKFHLTNIYRKLGVTNRASAVRYAIENGLVSV